AEDVKFSYDRYRGAGSREFQARVRQVEIVDAATVRFHLKEAWPDFVTFYGTTATAAGLIVPKKYLTKVGDDGFLKQPVGAGPSVLHDWRGRRERPERGRDPRPDAPDGAGGLLCVVAREEAAGPLHHRRR